MAKPKQTYQKNENEKKRRKKQQEKEEKRAQRKENSNKGKGIESMMAYVDHNGQLTDTPPDPKLKVEIRAEDILLGARSFVKDSGYEPKSGRIAIFHSDRNFGFIKDSQSQQKIFFHASETNFEIREGDFVNYEVISGLKGLNAVRITKK